MKGPDVVVDDYLLLQVLLENEPTELRPGGGRLFTTGLWYHRLCRALGDRRVVGALSRQLGAVEPRLAGDAITAVTTLPETVGLVSLRLLASPMAALIADGVRLNLMSLEALAAARHLGAELCLAPADRNPALLAAAEGLQVSTRLVAA